MTANTVVKKKRGRPKGSKTVRAVEDERANTTPEAMALLKRVRRMPSDHTYRLIMYIVMSIMRVLAAKTTSAHYAASTLLATILHSRREVSLISREDATFLVVYSLMSDNKSDLPACLSILGPEPSVLLLSLEEEAGSWPAPVRSQVSELLRLLYEIKTLVLGRYKALLRKRTTGLVWSRSSSGIVIESDDTFNNLVLAALRAVDKFNPRSGTLTSYISVWFNHTASSDFATQLGVAFTATRSARVHMVKSGSNAYHNHSVSIDDSKKAQQVAVLEPSDLASSDVKSQSHIDRMAVMADAIRGSGRKEFGSLLATIMPIEVLRDVFQAQPSPVEKFKKKAN